MGICSDDCDCHIEGADGIETDGLGSALSPYVISTEVGRSIPHALTAAERAALSMVDADRGYIAYDTDTGAAWIYDGTAYGWRRLSVYAVEATGAVTLNEPTTDNQLVCSVSLEAGVWAVWGKGYIEAEVDAGTGWDATLWNDTAATQLDITSMAIAGGEVPSVTASYWRNFALMDLVSLSVTSTISMRMRRATTVGTQLVQAGKLLASTVPAIRP